MTVLSTAGRLDEIKASGRSALIGYLPTGFPTVEQSIEAARTLVKNGVDIIELGIPYTDPVMDGPTIQHAVDIALVGGVRVADTFRVMDGLRDLDVPVLAMSYFNPLLQYGIDRFAADLVAHGGAGVITADLIPEEAGEWIAAADKHGVDKVFLVAPSSTPERLAITSQASRGFVYAASVMGVTGERTQVGNDAERLVRDTRAAGAPRVCVGLGVSTRVQAAGIASYADGVIVGSAFVRPLLADKPWKDRLKDLAHVASELALGVAEGTRKVVP